MHEWVSEKIGSETNSRLATNFNTSRQYHYVSWQIFSLSVSIYVAHNVGTYLIAYVLNYNDRNTNLIHLVQPSFAAAE